MKKKRQVILVCTSQKPKQSHEQGCLAKGSEEILAGFQHQAIGSEVDVRATPCLNNCGHAVCVKIFPGSSMYEHITPEHVDEIWKEHIEKGQEVKHLLAEKINRFLGI